SLERNSMTSPSEAAPAAPDAAGARRWRTSSSPVSSASSPGAARNTPVGARGDGALAAWSAGSRPDDGGRLGGSVLPASGSGGGGAGRGSAPGVPGGDGGGAGGVVGRGASSVAIASLDDCARNVITEPPASIRSPSMSGFAWTRMRLTSVPFRLSLSRRSQPL